MAGQIGDDPANVVQTGATPAIAGAQNRLGPRFGLAGTEDARLPGVIGQSGQQFGQLRHVLLGVIGPHAKAVQFDHLARQVLVQTQRLVGIPARAGRIGADRPVLIQIAHHRRMGFGRQHHVGEPTGQMRTDRILDKGVGHQVPIDRATGDGEMIGPEPDQTFPKAGRVIDCARETVLDRRTIDAAQPTPIGNIAIAGGRIAGAGGGAKVKALVLPGADLVQRHGLRPEFCGRRNRCRHFRRVGGRRQARRQAEAKADRGDFSIGRHRATGSGWCCCAASCHVRRPGSGHSFGNARRRRSRICSLVGSDGAPIIRSSARWFIGNMMTSRMFCSSASSITMRSMPAAQPPCGGAP